MGNAAFVYDRRTVDLGAQGVFNAQPGVSFEAQRVFAGTAQVTITSHYDAITVEKLWVRKGNPDLDLYLALLSFWNSWAGAGRPFAFALDSAKQQNIRITSDIGSGNMVDNGDMEIWPPSGAAPDKWTFGLSGSTTITRETAEGEVYEGLNALKWSAVAAAQSTAKITSARSIAAGAAVDLSFAHKGGAALGKIEYAIRDVTSNLYFQLDGISWAAGVAFWQVTPINQEYQAWTASLFANATGLYEVTFRNATTATNVWLDDVKLVQPISQISLRALASFVTGDAVRIVSRAGLYDEAVRLTSVTAGGSGTGIINFTPTLTRQYGAGDFVRNADFYPALVIDQKEPAVWESEGGTYNLKMKCRESMSGRV